MIETTKLKGEQVTIDMLVEAVKEYGSYPIFQCDHTSFKMRVLPTDHTMYEDGSIGFGQNGGSFNRKTPQMNVLTISKDSLIMEVDSAKLPDNLQLHVKSVKTFVIETPCESHYLIAYFPKHMTQDADLGTGAISSKLKQVSTLILK